MLRKRSVEIAMAQKYAQTAIRLGLFKVEGVQHQQARRCSRQTSAHRRASRRRYRFSKDQRGAGQQQAVADADFEPVLTPVLQQQYSVLHTDADDGRVMTLHHAPQPKQAGHKHCQHA